MSVAIATPLQSYLESVQCLIFITVFGAAPSPASLRVWTRERPLHHLTSLGNLSVGLPEAIVQHSIPPPVSKFPGTLQIATQLTHMKKRKWTKQKVHQQFPKYSIQLDFVMWHTSMNLYKPILTLFENNP